MTANKDTAMIFVYGTLKVGGRFADRFDNYRLEAVKAKIKGFDMYSIRAFPMIVESDDADAIVFGEYHYYDNASEVVPMFDMIEGYNSEKHEGMYLRKTTMVYDMDDNEIGECFVYVFNHEIGEGMEKLDGYFDHLPKEAAASN